MSEIRDLIKTLVGPGSDRYYVGEVTAVNGLVCDVQPNDDTAELKDIRLCAEDNSKLFVVIPKVGSIVYVTMDSDTSGMITGYSEVETILLRGDANGGLVKVEDLVSKLNALENKVNELITAFNTHTHICAAPASPSATPVPLISGTLPVTTRSQIENTGVKHG